MFIPAKIRVYDKSSGFVSYDDIVYGCVNCDAPLHLVDHDENNLCVACSDEKHDEDVCLHCLGEFPSDELDSDSCCPSCADELLCEDEDEYA